VSVVSGASATNESLRTVFQDFDEVPADFMVPPASEQASAVKAGTEKSRHQTPDDGHDSGDGTGVRDAEDEAAVDQVDDRGSQAVGAPREYPAPAGFKAHDAAVSDETQPDQEDRPWSWSEHLANCRALHICAPMAHFPTQGLLLAPSVGSSDAEASLFTGEDILRNLYLRNCGLVVLSRASVCDPIFTVKQLRTSRFQPFELSDAFIAAGALSVVQPLWTPQDDQGLATLLLMWKFYDLLIDVAHLDRPIAAALRQAQRWLRDLSCEDVRHHLLSRRIPENVRVGVEEILWLFACTAEYGSESKYVLKASGFNQHPELLQTKPFQNPYYWTSFRAMGACAGVHRSGLGEVSDDESDEDPDPGVATEGTKPKFEWEEYHIKTDPRRAKGYRLKKWVQSADAGLDKLEKQIQDNMKVLGKGVTAVVTTLDGPRAADDKFLAHENWKRELDEIYTSAHPNVAERLRIEQTAPSGPGGEPQQSLLEGDGVSAQSLVAKMRDHVQSTRAHLWRSEVQSLYQGSRSVVRARAKAKVAVEPK
jgi:hypothetical protein